MRIERRLEIHQAAAFHTELPITPQREGVDLLPDPETAVEARMSQDAESVLSKAFELAAMPQLIGTVRATKQPTRLSMPLWFTVP